MKISIFDKCKIFRKLAAGIEFTPEALDVTIPEEGLLSSEQAPETPVETIPEAPVETPAEPNAPTSPIDQGAQEAIDSGKVTLNRNNEPIPTKGNEAWFAKLDGPTYGKIKTKLNLDRYTLENAAAYNKLSKWKASKMSNLELLSKAPGNVLARNPIRTLSILGSLYGLYKMFSGRTPEAKTENGKNILQHFSQSEPSIKTPQIVSKILANLSSIKESLGTFSLTASSDNEKDGIKKLTQRVDFLSDALNKLDASNLVLDDPSSASSFISTYKQAENACGYMIQGFYVLGKLFAMHNQPSIQIDSLKELVGEFLAEIHNLRS